MTFDFFEYSDLYKKFPESWESFEWDPWQFKRFLRLSRKTVCRIFHSKKFKCSDRFLKKSLEPCPCLGLYIKYARKPKQQACILFWRILCFLDRQVRLIIRVFSFCVQSWFLLGLFSTDQLWKIERFLALLSSTKGHMAIGQIKNFFSPYLWIYDRPRRPPRVRV